MFKSIPASHIAAVYPAVISAGGNPLGLNANVLADDAIYPNFEYTSAVLVGEHYGLTSDIYQGAVVYFNGFERATTRPNSLFITRHNAVDRAAQLIGASVKNVTIAQIKAITTGTLSVVIDGSEKQATPIDLSTVNSFSDAATAISTALGATVEYNAQMQVFVVKSGTVGAGSTVSYATGTVAELLNLTQAKGAQVDNDTVADSIETATQRMLNYSQNFATIVPFGASFSDDKLKELALWSTAQKDRFHLITFGLDPLATIPNSTVAFGAWAKEYTSGVTPVYGDFKKAMFFASVDASINYSETNGRTTTAFRSQTGLEPDVTDEATADALVSNGYSYYGAWATANDRFQMAGNGMVTGPFKWIDNYMFAVFLNSQFQLASVQSLVNYKSIPYNADGIAIRRAVLQDPIDQGINFGGIRAGVQLTNQQISLINMEAGFDAASQIQTKGWALSIQLPSAQARAEREPFIEKFFYTDGSSLQRIELTSTNVQ